MTITVPDKLVNNKDIFTFISGNFETWMKDAKELFDSKIRVTNNGWNYDVYNKRVCATKRLRYWGLINTGFIAKMTYNGKRFNVKIVEEKGE